MIAEFDHHGALDTTGLGVCTVKKLQATTVAEARHACADAIVGEGVGHGVVQFPEQKPIPILELDPVQRMRQVCDLSRFMSRLAEAGRRQRGA